jgi:hypothetical protein
MAEATTAQELGALGFGLVIGWNLYAINRYRKGIGLGDLATIIGAIGGAAILDLFPAGTDLFGWYGIGLAAGFFAYFLILVVLVRGSDEFGANWFLDGRRKKIATDEMIPEGTAVTVHPMADDPGNTGG